MSLHSRIFVPGVSRAAPLSTNFAPLHSGTSAAASSAPPLHSGGKGFVPPAQTRPFAPPMGAHDGGAALAGTPHRGANDAMGGAAHARPLQPMGATLNSSKLAAPLPPPLISSATAVPPASFSLPQPPPLAGALANRHTSSQSNVASTSVSVAHTPLCGHASAAYAQPLAPTTAAAAPANCGHAAFCPCCGRRGRFVHDGEDDASPYPSSSSGSALLQGVSADNGQKAPAAAAAIVDLTRRPPTAYKLYCDAVEPSLIAKKMNMKDRKASMAQSFEALGAAERAAYEAKALALAKEQKMLKKQAAKAGRSGGVGAGSDEPAPKRTKSSFMIFSDERRASATETVRAGLAEGARVNIADVARLIGEMWKGLTEEERKGYSDRAEALKRAAAEGPAAPALETEPKADEEEEAPDAASEAAADEGDAPDAEEESAADEEAPES